MDNETQELTKELAQSEKRKQWRERKKLKQQTLRDKPPPPPDNSRFLARPWINLPAVDKVPAQHRVRVMTWNVCTIFSGRPQSKLNLKSSY